ncbi:MAG: hypothetical protein CBHOC_4612 [uncultured Caballeronia sp.]|nr:MAG: hypothetical protein CBHOC_4612 [uncultured Caballeronia sp.]
MAKFPYSEGFPRHAHARNGNAKMHVYVEPLPKGRWGPIEGYILEFLDGTRITQQVYRSERLAVNEIKLRVYSPLLVFRSADSRTKSVKFFEDRIG